MPLGDDILFASVRELGERIRKRALSPVELTEAYLARAQRLGAELGAFATLTRDLARAQARKAEDEIAAGTWRGPLHGIPYAAKDLLAVRWYPTTWGAAPFAQRKLDVDATVIQKLTDAGAVLVGKAAMIELAGGLGYRFPSASATGATKNPWDRKRWTCGSSSGSAAIVAAGLAAFAIGSETWGSILCPSAHTGVTGLRPTYGRVSRHGAMALSYTLDKLGPMARSAEDCALVLQAIAGHDPADGSSLPQAEAQFRWPPYEKAPLSRLRIGWVAPPAGASPAVESACRAALELLRRAGAAVEPATLPEGPWSAATTVILYGEAGSALRRLVDDGTVQKLNDPAARLGGYLYQTVPASDLVSAQRIRLVAQKKMETLFQQFDVLAAPARPELAWPIDANLDEVEDLADPLGCLGNLCGLPAISVPCGLSPKEKLPIGIQLVGRALDEQTVVTAAMHLQSLGDWHKRRPPV